MTSLSSYSFQGQSASVLVSASPRGNNNNRIAIIAHPTVDPNTYHAMAYDSTPYCLYAFIKDLEERGLSTVRVDLWIEVRPRNGNALDILKSLVTGDVYTGDSLSLEAKAYKSVLKLARSVDKNVPGGQPSYYDMLTDTVRR